MSWRRIAATARLDFLANLRRPLYWVLLLILGLFAWLYAEGSIVIDSGDSTTGGDKSWITSEFALTNLFTVLALLIHGFFVSVAAGMPLLQDRELRVTELLHATPLTPREYVFGKFLAIVLSLALIVALQLGLTAGLVHAIDTTDLVGPFAAVNYWRPALVFMLPLFLFLSGVCFWVGGRFGRPILVFLLPVALLLACAFFLWGWAPSWLDPRLDEALMLLDPVGRRWLRQTWLVVDRGVDFYNTQPLAFDWPFLASRVGFAAIGLLALLRSARDLERSLHAKPGLRPLAPAPESQSQLPSAGRVHPPLANLRMRAKVPGFLAGTWQCARTELCELRSQPGLYIFVPLIVMETMALVSSFLGPFETPLLATSGVLATRTLGALTTMTCLLLLFYTVESLRREVGCGLAPIVYSTPLRTGALLLGKALANSVVGLAVVLANLLVALGIILYQNRVPLDLEPFALVWGLLLTPTLLFWCCLVTALYALTGSRYTTYAFALGLLIWTAWSVLAGDGDWSNNWPLWGSLSWTDMGVFEFDREALVLNRSLLVCASFFLIALTVRLFPRRDFDATRTIHRLRPKSLAIASLKLVPAALPAIAVYVTLLGAIDSGFQGEDATEADKRYWRRNVATFTDAALPDYEAFEAVVHLAPETRGIEVEGELTLVNNRDEDLAWIPLTTGAHWRETTWTLDGESIEPEEREGLVLVRPPGGFARGASHVIGYAFHGSFPEGITKNGGGTADFVLASGVVLTSFSPDFAPVLGFQAGRGVDEENQFDSKEYPSGHQLGITPAAFGSGQAFPVRLEVTAPEEYTINGVGTKTLDEVEAGTRRVVWQSDHPVRFFNIVAGRWREARGQGTVIYHHPAHDYNIAEMLEALDGARQFYSQWFLPFPWAELKLSEFPALASYAQGFPTNITFSESVGFLTRSSPEAQAAFMVTAHESAHQWWGNLLMPGRGPGGNILSEGMAHFSTILLTGQLHGERARIELCKRFENEYAESRVVDSEHALVSTDGSRPGDTTVTYDKGGWVFWMLQQQMGREQNLAGLQAFIRHYQGNPDHPLLEDFVEQMRPFAPEPEAFDAFVEQWFLQVVAPEFELSDVERKMIAAGGEAKPRWEVSATLKNKGSGLVRVELAASYGERFPDDASESSEVSSASAPESASAGATAAGSPEASDSNSGASGSRADARAYREARTSVTLGAGEERQLEIPCDFEPSRLVVDPDALLLQLHREKALHEF